MLSLFVALLLTTSCYAASSNPKIGIIGAGIGGTTCAHYLRELFANEVEIDMYERGPIGGRLATVNINGATYESGGSVIHPANAYMVNFTNMLGLKKRDDLDGGRMGLFNGKEMVFESSSWSPLVPLQLLWRYGWDIFRIDKYIRSLLHDFNNIYEYQNNGYAFTTVENLLTSMSPRFVELLHTATKDTFKKAGFSDLFIDELVRAGMRTNYGQCEHINSFVGSVSMAGIQPGLWSIHGGNKRVPEELVLRTKVNLIRSKVTTVTLTSPSPNTQYKVTSESHDGSKEETDYDIVVVAAPLNDFIAGISFEHFPKEIPTYPQHFHTTYATFLKGIPNAKTFGLDNVNDFPTAVLTTEFLYFSSIGRHQPVDFTADGDYNSVYKVFSNEPLSSDQLNSLFTSHEKFSQIEWKAYPQYGSEEYNLPPFELHDHLYYVNGIEIAASSMEVSAIAGRNVANLAWHRWKKNVRKVDSVEVLKDGNMNQEL